MLGLSGLPQVSRSCLPMWVTWQLFLTASVTKGNATLVTRLTSAGHLHCRLQLLCSPNRPFQTLAMKGLLVFPSLCAERHEKDSFVP